MREKDTLETSQTEEEAGGQGERGPVLCLWVLPPRQQYEGHLGSVVGAHSPARAERRGAARGRHLHVSTLHRGFWSTATPLETSPYCHGHQEHVSTSAHIVLYYFLAVFVNSLKAS